MISIDTAQEKILIIDILEACIQEKKAFALYRLPNESSYQLMISEQTEIEKRKIDFEESISGFVFASFNEDLPRFIRADYFTEFKSDYISKNNLPDFLNLSEKSQRTTHEGFKFSPTESNESLKTEYLQKISGVIGRIKNGETHKVVISRKKNLGKISEKNYLRGFTNLCEHYPSAFVSLTYASWANQIWMGASPEILVSQGQNGIFKTVALAGTQSVFSPNGEEIAPIDALWSHKEIEEQALVSRYIINCLKKIRVREFLEYGPKTVKAGNLFHLCTTYSIDTKEINFPNLSSVMLDLLHPTSAVCGIPKEPSLQIIKDSENYNREYYSGYLGPVNIKNESHVFVNLRSMKIENDEIFAFAGGGITEDSVPEKEWNETEIKLNTIQKSFDF